MREGLHREAVTDTPRARLLMQPSGTQAHGSHHGTALPVSATDRRRHGLGVQPLSPLSGDQARPDTRNWDEAQVVHRHVVEGRVTVLKHAAEGPSYPRETRRSPRSSRARRKETLPQKYSRDLQGDRRRSTAEGTDPSRDPVDLPIALHSGAVTCIYHKPRPATGLSGM